MRRVIPAAVVAVALIAPASSAACIRLGVYEDHPTAALPALRATVGRHLTTVSIYLGARERVPAATLRLVRRSHLQLVVTWEPDDQHQPQRSTLPGIRSGRYDAALRRLARQLSGLAPAAILRPLPEPNTVGYAWSSGLAGNTPTAYRKAWQRIARVVEGASHAGPIRLLWSPAARSLPDDAYGTITSWFPGRAVVDLVGASAYNFGATADLDWTQPGTLFQDAYDRIEAVARRPFWIAETGSTSLGGDKAAWIRSLGALPEAMPRLAGIIWYDVDAFRIRETHATTRAFRTLARRAC